MRCERVCICLFLVGVVLFASKEAGCGYELDSSYKSDSHRFWYIVEVGSGSPPPFRDMHVETEDPDSTHYELALAPPGWQMSIVPKNDGTDEAWISFYGEDPCSYAFFKVEYSGEFHARAKSDWLLTQDGDPDPNTGAIPGENGVGATALSRYGAGDGSTNRARP
jgi:hypothetical protein